MGDLWIGEEVLRESPPGPVAVLTPVTGPVPVSVLTVVAGPVAGPAPAPIVVRGPVPVPCTVRVAVTATVPVRGRFAGVRMVFVREGMRHSRRPFGSEVKEVSEALGARVGDASGWRRVMRP